MRLIDADELMKKCNCQRDCNECNFFTEGDSWCNGNIFGTTVMQMPTVDAVPVVRCKDCKYLIDRDNETHGCYIYLGYDAELNGFCSHGKKSNKNE